MTVRSSLLLWNAGSYELKKILGLLLIDAIVLLTFGVLLPNKFFGNYLDFPKEEPLKARSYALLLKEHRFQGGQGRYC
jgi:hypothetical protein